MLLQPPPPTSTIWMGSDLTDEAFIEAARELLSQGEIVLLPNMLILAERHPDVWQSEAGQALLIGMLTLLIDTFELNDGSGALAAMDVCLPHLARQAHDLLLMAFFPDGAMGDPADLDDAALLTLALLIGASGRTAEVSSFLDRAQVGRSSYYFTLAADQIRARYAASASESEAFKAKLIIWDLDDTLWQGTLADGDEPVLFDHRADYVRAFNRHGIVSAICSKNDFATAKAKLEGFGLWDEFVFPRIAFVPKGAVIGRMIADMQLRPANVLFIDDNPHNLHEVADAVPGIHVVDATSAECDALLRQILDDNAHVAKSRVADYRLIETRVAERGDNELGDEAFLMQSGIHATFVHRMDNLEFADRLEELINRSNQLNYTASRIEPGRIHHCIQDMDNYVVMSLFVWDKYGYYGLVGVAVWAWRTRKLEHLAFSCRIMHMGVEDAMIRQLVKIEDYQIDPAQLRKPLPPQSSKAITLMPYADPEVRKRILDAEAPRDWSKISLRIMADCQSGAFFHYSRFRDVIEHDNNPRLFSLPMMMTGEYEAQDFPPYLMFAAASDYAVWRWHKLSDTFDLDIYRQCAERFVELVVTGHRKCLVTLPPQDLHIYKYMLHKDCDLEETRARHPVLNDLWRDIARRHPGHFTLIELADELAGDDYVSAHHYAPSALRHIAGLIDDWYAAQTGKAEPIAA